MFYVKIKISYSDFFKRYRYLLNKDLSINWQQR